MERIARGDAPAFAALFDRHQAGVVRFAQRFLGSRARAEDAAQEVFLKVHRSAASYRPTAAFKTWLFRIVTNHCLNAERGQKARPDQLVASEEASPMTEPRDAADPAGTLEARELEGVVHRALQAMSDRERAAFAMCRFDGLAYRDIAEVLGATELAVKSLIHRATVTMMKHLDAHRVSSPAVAGAAR